MGINENTCAAAASVQVAATTSVIAAAEGVCDRRRAARRYTYGIDGDDGATLRHAYTRCRHAAADETATAAAASGETATTAA